MLRVLLDANIFMSFLLTSRSASPPVRVVEAALAGGYLLIFPDEVASEILRRTAAKPYLRRRIPAPLVDRLIADLRAVAIPRPGPLHRPGAISRDPKDDYLLAHAIAARADYLVLGDKDLLVLGRVEGVRIVDPAEFLGILAAGGGVA